LEDLNLYQTKVSDEGVKSLRAALPECQIGYSIKARQEALAVFQKLGAKFTGNLQKPSVDLSNTKVTDAGLVHLRGLNNLRHLNLSNTKVSDAGLDHLRDMTSITSLFLWNTSVTDAGLVHLQGLTKLKVMVLWNTKITDAGLVADQFGNAGSLRDESQ
jgi:hypothetical protein